jgi:hypothetical protein
MKLPLRAYTPIDCGNQVQELARALGDMILAWQNAEYAQVDCFAAILNTEHYKASRLYQKLPNFRSRTQALLLLVELHPAFTAIQPHVLKLSKLSKTRNGWVHGVMLMPFGGIRSPDDLNDLRTIDLDEPSESDKRSKPIKAGDIKNHADAVRHASASLTEALKNVPAYEAWSATLLLNQMRAAGLPDKPPEGPSPPPETAG